jgi:hypothetical protein
LPFVRFPLMPHDLLKKVSKLWIWKEQLANLLRIVPWTPAITLQLGQSNLGRHVPIFHDLVSYHVSKELRFLRKNVAFHFHHLDFTLANVTGERGHQLCRIRIPKAWEWTKVSIRC